MKGLNLSGFKKIASDDKTTTFKHDKGHTIQIAHNAIHPEMRQQLHALPMVDSATTSAKAADKDPNQSPQEAQAEQKMADGGNVVLEQSKMADGGEVADNSQDTSQDSGKQPIVINVGQPQQMMGQQQPQQTATLDAGSQPFQMGGVSPAIAPTAGLPDDTKGQNGQEIPQAQAPTTAQAPQPQAAAAAPPANSPVEGSGSPQDASAAPQQPQDPYGMNAYSQGMDQGFNTQLTGINDQARAAQIEGNARVAGADAEMGRQQTLFNDFNQRVSALNQEQDAAVKDYAAGHIDPNQYMASMSTGKKVATSIGLILGGMGGAITHQGNPALAFLNAQIDRDIDAQKANLGKQNNLVSHYTMQLGNARDGALMANSIAKSLAAAQFKKAAATAQGPMAKSQAMQAAGLLYRDAAAMHRTIGMNQMMMKLTSGQQSPDQIGSAINVMRQFDPEKAKEMSSRFIPNVGLSQVPISETMRGQAIAMQDFDHQMKSLYSWAQQHSGESKATNPADVNTGRAMAQAAQNSYRTAQQMGVWKASEAPLLDGEIPQDPTAFFNKYRVLPQYRAVMQNTSRKMNDLYKSLGIPQQQIQKVAPVAPTKK